MKLKWFKRSKGGGRWGIYIRLGFQWDRRDPDNIKLRKYMYFKNPKWENYAHPDWEAHAQREISERTDKLDSNALTAWIHDYPAYGEHPDFQKIRDSFNPEK